MADWPTSIPVTRRDYVETAPDRVIRSTMEIGPQKTRRRSSSAVRPVSFRLFLTDTQIQTLDEFFDTNDALAFNFADPRTQTVKRARFVEPPSYPLEQTHWNVSVKLEYLP
jgi:hypothetical protein